ncbi:MAG: MOSC domain-containing protein, partial [Candidatus Neomarinimicrobiota bacterium]
MGIVKAISISRKKGTVKREIPVARFEAQHGIVGDAHAGPWHRQVSLLAEESFLSVRSLLPGLAVGAFAENLLISGLE